MLNRIIEFLISIIMLQKNGFTLPFHPYQILSWVIFIWHLIVPYFLDKAISSSISVSIFFVIHYLSCSLIFYYAIKITKSVPSINFQAMPIFLETGEFSAFFCTVCQSYVNRSAKHCGVCNRCVEDFDHHCKWLNNCIGRKNYLDFIKLIIWVEISHCFLLAFEFEYYHKISGSIEILLVSDGSFNTLISFLIGYLIIFHSLLRYYKMTTYEFIKYLKRKKNKKTMPSITSHSSSDGINISGSKNSMKNPHDYNGIDESNKSLQNKHISCV